MTVLSEVVAALDRLYDPAWADDWDAVGTVVGDPDAPVAKVLLAVAWVLRQPNISAAIIGASRPEQVTDNAKASGVVLGDDVLAAIDEALGDVVVRDPRTTDRQTPDTRPT